MPDFITISAIVGLLASIITLCLFFYSDLGRRFIGIFIRGPHFNLESIPKKITRAQRRLWVLQTWLPGLRLELPYWRKALSNEHIDCRVLLLDQKLVQYRLRCRELVSSLLPQNVSDLTDLANVYNIQGKPRLEVRFYSCIPFGPIYIIDDDIYW